MTTIRAVFLFEQIPAAPAENEKVDPEVIWEILIGKLPELAPVIRDVSSEIP